jgi:hypothetical protein
MRLDEDNFMVRINADWLVSEVDGREIRGVAIPSAALRLTYARADALCAALRRGRHKEAVVCNAMGIPVSLADLRGETV